ncbi:hypothetical protein PHMEG_00036335 [Phytophthora megakarya]|uniref:Uncharacterized protein n=1 Tax=Phytophthora megakarya TaxID=4795 RepID=A0A225UPM7_9STRA|nr:hypothetical protein PHMEG_00036335 [Phytophthora megakarya]
MKRSATLAYSSCINDSIERQNRDILQVGRVMLFEFKVEQENGSALLPLFQENLNHSLVP